LIRTISGKNGVKMKILYYGTCYLKNQEHLVFMQSWLKIAHKQRDCDLLMIDSASPDDLMKQIEFGRCELFRFPENVGHMYFDNRDGWGRAMCKGVEIAHERGYDWCVHIESDVASRLDARQICELLADHDGVCSGAPYCNYVNGIETGLMWMRVPELVKRRFVELYDWPNMRDNSKGGVMPELKIPQITPFITLNLTGGRNANAPANRGKEGPLSPLLDTRLMDVHYFTHANVKYFLPYAEGDLIRVAVSK
jgi:hypothetical protein